MRTNNRALSDKLFGIVKQAIDEFNPYRLLPHAPNDEFDSESREIVSMITVDSTIEEISEVISKVFTRALDDDDFNVVRCRVPAENIHRSLGTSTSKQ